MIQLFRSISSFLNRSVSNIPFAMSRHFAAHNLFVAAVFIVLPAILLPAGPAQAQFAGGSGTAEDPYQIETIQQFQKIGELTYRSSHFIQVADIDASDTKNWNDGQGFKPISFHGDYDGKDYVISNLYINRQDEDFVGLVSSLAGNARSGKTAKIRRLGLVNVDITGGNYVGGLAGYKIMARIETSFVKGRVTGQRQVGGLIGHFERSCDGSEPPPDKFPVILRSYSQVTVSGTEKVGGVAGSAAATFATGIYYGCGGIHETYASGQVSGEDMVGGWAGVLDDLRFQSANYWDISLNEDLEAIGFYFYTGSDPNIIEGLNTDQMTGQNAFIHMYELDFVNAWQLTEGYPVLRWQDPDDTVDPPEVPIIRMDTTKRDFGEVSIDSSVTMEVPIQNSGNNMLNGKVYLAGPDAALFAIADGLSTFSLEVDSSQTVAITFLPESLESYEAELYVVHDAPNRSDTLIITLVGEGKEPTDARPNPDLPGELALHQNYPNPFNPSTVIAYRIPEESHVRLDVYDITGRRVSRLVDEMQAPGDYQVIWDASERTSGIYLFRLSASGHTLTRRMTLIR